MQNAYLALNGPHPLLTGLEDTPRIIHGVSRVATKPDNPSTKSPLLLIPTYPDLPMEEVYPRPESKTNQPEVYVREHGKGRVVYFPFDIDRTYWEILANDHGRLLKNAVAWADTAPLKVSGPGMLDVTLWRQEHSVTVHLVNLTNSMAMRGFVREPVAVGPFRVELTLPTVPKNIQLLTAGKKPESAIKGATVTVTIPSVSVHEVIAFDVA